MTPELKRKNEATLEHIANLCGVMGRCKATRKRWGINEDIAHRRNEGRPLEPIRHETRRKNPRRPRAAMLREKRLARLVLSAVSALVLLTGCATHKQPKIEPPKAPLLVVNTDTSARILGVEVGNVCPGSIALVPKDSRYEEITLKWDTSGHCWSLITR